MKKGVSDFKIGTLGSHSALQILKGARDEGFRNMVVCLKGAAQPYHSYRVADEIIEVPAYKDVIKLEQKMAAENVILIPHGSFFAAFGLEALGKFKVDYFGNKKILAWEEDRTKQRQWLAKAGLTLPRIYEDPKDIEGPVIIKFHGAGGGRGYFLASNADEFQRKIKEHPNKRYIIQRYVVGTPMYIHYFYSPLTKELEIMSLDRRYETNVDSIGRIGAKDQLDLNIESSYNIMGNLPLVARESLLPKMFEMGEAVVKASRQLEPRGLFGPFCLETIVTPDLEFYVFEISARIVAGTNPYIKGSPYTDLRYDEPMSTGRRVAREIKTAIEQGRLDEVLSD
ncbi:MAG TPA: formate--phosphoribosylaminoimidazolecarboxamide ligase [Candidatus Saccharimonadales bacterium]|nr:formate--phosphoribosylaminoimidazolecarboxamide ligase [Candidatus Saccharimonadales bacterium]